MTTNTISSKELAINEKPTVFIIDDDQAILKSLSWLIETDGLSVKTFADANSFLSSYEPYHPACLLLDIRMPNMTGLELQEELITKNISIPIIFISGHADIPIAVDALRKGAINFLTKPFNDSALMESVYEALKSDSATFVKEQVVNDYQKKLARLSPREKEVLQLMVAGKMNKVIAFELGIQIKTVEIHRAHIMKKTEAKSLAHLVKMVLTCSNHGKPSIISEAG